MTARMTKDKWDAVFIALSVGIDALEDELLHADPDDTETYGALEYRWEQAKQAHRILLHRRYKD